MHIVEGSDGYPIPLDFRTCERLVLQGLLDGLTVIAVDSGLDLERTRPPCVI